MLDISADGGQIYDAVHAAQSKWGSKHYFPLIRRKRKADAHRTIGGWFGVKLHSNASKWRMLIFVLRTPIGVLAQESPITQT